MSGVRGRTSTSSLSECKSRSAPLHCLGKQTQLKNFSFSQRGALAFPDPSVRASRRLVCNANSPVPGYASAATGDTFTCQMGLCSSGVLFVGCAHPYSDPPTLIWIAQAVDMAQTRRLPRFSLYVIAFPILFSKNKISYTDLLA